MATYVELWDLQNNETFQKRVRYALTKTASDIMGEAPGGDAKRKEWAKKVFAGALTTPINLITLRVLGNAAIAAAGAAATDADIQFTVNQMAGDLITLG